MNKYLGKHHLGDRARKLDQGILIIRFEMPFDVWCNKCGELIPHGRRFNAEKKQVEKYLNIPIYSFRFKCNACDNHLDIHTDPKNSDFIVASGGKKKVQESQDIAEDAGLPRILSKSDREQAADPFSQLEHAFDDKEKGKAQLPVLHDILEVAERRYGDSVANNRLARSLHRVERKKAEALENEAKSRGLGMKLLPTTSEDELEAQVSMAAARTSRPAPHKLMATAANSQRSSATESIFGKHSTSEAHKRALLATMKSKQVDLRIFQPKKTK